MNEEYSKILNTLNENIQQVILLYNKEKKLNDGLSSEVKKLSDELNIYKEKYQDIERKYDNLRMAKALGTGNNEDNDAKLKLNKIIREINNCIALLNK
jgi:Na+-transporting NADH:ubiquinone oxidoreductase subunit NqrF